MCARLWLHHLLEASPACTTKSDSVATLGADLTTGNDLGLQPVKGSGRDVRVPLDENHPEIRPLVLVVKRYEVT